LLTPKGGHGGGVGRALPEFFPWYPPVSPGPPRGSSANFVNEGLWDQMGGRGTADLTMLWLIVRPISVDIPGGLGHF